MLVTAGLNRAADVWAITEKTLGKSLVRDGDSGRLSAARQARFEHAEEVKRSPLQLRFST